MTVMVPCLDEEAHIERVVSQALNQRCGDAEIEVVVAEGGSRDRTRSILERLKVGHCRLRVIDNPDRIQAAGLNRILRVARGSVVVRMDAHCDYPTHYVANCLRELERTGAAGVGGAQRIVGATPFGRAIEVAMRSPLAMGGAEYRDPKRSGWVDTVFLGAYQLEAVLRVGGYDTKAVTNEDAELNQRLIRHGERLWLSADIEAHYHPRSSLSALGRQYRRYGEGRARTLLKHRHLLRIRPVLPFAGLLSFALACAIAPTAGAILAAAYVGATAIETWRVSRIAEESRNDRGDLDRVAVWSVFPTIHLAHALGFAVGLVRHAFTPSWSQDRAEQERNAS